MKNKLELDGNVLRWCLDWLDSGMLPLIWWMPMLPCHQQRRRPFVWCTEVILCNGNNVFEADKLNLYSLDNSATALIRNTTMKSHLCPKKKTIPKTNNTIEFSSFFFLFLSLVFFRWLTEGNDAKYVLHDSKQCVFVAYL